eukprot:scaffold8679_cov121-Isochrysis_galbana.AAC.16
MPRHVPIAQAAPHHSLEFVDGAAGLVVPAERHQLGAQHVNLHCLRLRRRAQRRSHLRRRGLLGPHRRVERHVPLRQAGHLRAQVGEEAALLRDALFQPRRGGNSKSVLRAHDGDLFERVTMRVKLGSCRIQRGLERVAVRPQGRQLMSGRLHLAR